ncbi:MAG: long-chain-fatty-acid--CoA ligase LcfA [Chloroflexota bacterium]
MQATPSPTASNADSYDARPWLRHYPKDVAPSLNYPNQSVWQVLQEVAHKNGRRPAFVFQGESMSYGELLKLSDQMSRALSRAGVGKGDRVLALLPNTPHFPVTYHGVLRLGAALSGASPRSVERELENFIRDSRAKTIVTLDVLYDKIAPIWEKCGVETVIVGSVIDFMPAWKRLAAKVTKKVPVPKDPVPYGSRVRSMLDFLASGRGQQITVEAVPDDIALLQYTGGTTGTPKAAMLTHANLLTNARQGVSLFPTLQEGEETLMGVLPFFHIYAITLVMNCALLIAARTILFPRGLEMAEIFEAIRKYRPTVFPGVPTIYVSIINDKRSQTVDMSSIEICASGGSPLPLEVKQDFERMTHGHLYEAYGLSEASPITHAQPHDESGKLGSIGLPVPDTEARIVDAETGDPVPVGETGELVVRGPQVMRGYWNLPDDTAAVLRDGWLHTGDIAHMDADGFFFIVDRKKDLIITAGENIYPREIEEALFEHPKVKEVAVVGVPHRHGGEVAKAFVVLKPGEEVTKPELSRFLSERLAKHKVPRSFEFRDSLPTSAAGKVLRRVLAEEEKQRQAAALQNLSASEEDSKVKD